MYVQSCRLFVTQQMLQVFKSAQSRTFQVETAGDVDASTADEQKNPITEQNAEERPDITSFLTLALISSDLDPI